MTNLDLLEYLGNVDDKYIMESRRRPRQKKPLSSLKSVLPVAIAACFVLVIAGGAVGLGIMFGGIGSTPEDAFSSAAGETLEARAGEPVADAAPAEAPEAEAAPEEEAVPETPADTTAGTAQVSDYNVTQLGAAAYPKSLAQDDYEERRAVWTENQVSADTAYALNAFAYSTASKVLQNQEESGCYSPLSLYQTLAVLASGAEGQTRDEILSLLGQTDLSTLTTETGKLYRVNYADNDVNRMKIANSLWLDESTSDGTPIDYKQEWVISASNDYYADVFAAEFDLPETGEALGAWIAENTGGFLHPSAGDMGLTENTVMAIVNTVWYKTQWQWQFDANKTETRDFITESGETVAWDFMQETDADGQAIVTDTYTKSYLDLNQGKMIFVLPKEGVDVDSLLSEEKLWEIFENGDYAGAEVRWSVPKFETEVNYDLVSVLKDLGVTSAFGEGADFATISDSPLFVGGLRQGTHISVNEDGVEAAAFTLAEMEAGAGPLEEEPPVVEMDLSRPFIYLITAHDGSTAFMGVVRNPAK